jgi:DNA-binding NtrC family response regulator
MISELFGHVKGAFTGADRDRQGFFQSAQGGTIFLDEIGDLPLHDQAKLLRVIETREIIPVGSSQPVQLDVRILAATNAPLAEKLRAGTFREDLFYRLQQFALHIPPLREREEDIIPLARYFLQQIAETQNGSPKTLSPSALLALKSHAWRGNVRELQHTVRRAYLTAPGREITGSHLQLLNSESPDAGKFKAARMHFERDYLKSALAAHRGNITAAAKAVGLSRQGLQKKMHELGLDLRDEELK